MTDFGDRTPAPPPAPRSALERMRARLAAIRQDFTEEFGELPVYIGPGGDPRFDEWGS